MRQLIIAMSALWLGVAAAIAQTAPATPPQLLSTTTPDNTSYQENPGLLTGCQARLAAFQDKSCDIIFIGDQITANWLTIGKAVWDKYYATRHAFNFGVSGDATQNVLWRLANMNVQQLNPKVAVVLIGTNNNANGPHEIAAGVEAVLTNTEVAFPGVKIILVSIPPSVRANGKMMQADSIIKNFADNSSTYYLDLVSHMPAVTTTAPGGKTETNWTGLGDDGLNLNASGYEIWASTMEPLLTKLLTEK
jgi:beta-glucosidase